MRGVIETERLRLRPWTDADAPALFELAREPELGYGAGWQPHRSVEESLTVIQTVLGAPHTYAVELRVPSADGEPAGTLVGAVGLMGPDASDLAFDAGEYEIGYWTGKPFWGRGYAPEAAGALMGAAQRELGARAIWLGYYAGNERSAHVAKKLGFRAVRVRRGVDVPLLGERRDEVDNLLVLLSPEGRRALVLLAARDDPARHLCTSESVRLGRADVLMADEQLGVLARFAGKGAYLASPFSAAGARAMGERIEPGAVVSLDDAALAGELAPGAEVWPYDGWVYEAAEPPAEVGAPLEMRPLTVEDTDAVDAQYALMDRDGVEDHLRRGWVIGGYDGEGRLVGFIGEHHEASMGMLEVFPWARRHGYATTIEAAQIRAMLEADRIPFCQVAPDNEASQALQRRLGLRRIGQTQCWLHKPET